MYRSARGHKNMYLSDLYEPKPYVYPRALSEPAFLLLLLLLIPLPLSLSILPPLHVPRLIPSSSRSSPFPTVSISPLLLMLPLLWRCLEVVLHVGRRLEPLRLVRRGGRMRGWTVRGSVEGKGGVEDDGEEGEGDESEALREGESSRAVKEEPSQHRWSSSPLC
jgi:hypothetical protein